MYSRPEHRSPCSVLRLSNIVFKRAALCVSKIYNPKAKSVTKANYFNTLTAHSPQFYQEITLRSLNSEFQENVVWANEQVTQSTSNKHPQLVIDNAIVRVQAEASRTQSTIKREEGEVTRLATTLSKHTNSIFSREWIDRNSMQFQCHLERISDYLLPCPGVWWRFPANQQIEFLDGPDEEASRAVGPQIEHFRSFKVHDIPQFLHQNVFNRTSHYQCLLYERTMFMVT